MAWNDPDPLGRNPSNPDPKNPETSGDQGITPSQKDEFLEVGRISKIRSEIDQEGKISTQLKNRMSVIDLIPCLFKVNYGTFLDGNSTSLSDKFKPTIEYKKAIDDFASTQWSYGLKEYAFLRLYLTDMTSSSDDISNEYGKNVIDSGLDSLSSSSIGKLMSSLYKYQESTGTGKGIANDPLKFMSEMTSIPVSSSVSTGAELAAQVLTHGSRISFPKIWNNSTYSPNLSCVVKLVSPYGHPKAINEFIIKPLAYLLILLSPTTTQGITTNRPNYLTLKSYGLSNMTLCYPRQLTIRRGGDDSSYNQFLQPMTVEVSMTFEAVTEGFACFILPSKSSSSTELHSDGQIFKVDSSSSIPLPEQDFSKDFNPPSALFPTLKSMVNSFRPFGNTILPKGVSAPDPTKFGLTSSASISTTNVDHGLSTTDPISIPSITDISVLAPPEGIRVNCVSGV